MMEETTIKKENLAPYCYYIGQIGFLIALIVSGRQLLAREISDLFVYTFPLIAAFGVLIEYVPKISRRIQKLFQVENPFSKWLLGITAAGLGLVLLLPATKLAGNIINGLTNENPDYFNNTRVFLTGLTGGGIILFGAVAGILSAVMLYACALSLISTAGMLGLRSNWLERVKIGQVFGKALGGIALMGVLGLIFIKSYTLLSFAPHLLVFADYYQNSPCTNQKPSELVAFLERDQISVAVPTETGSYRFERRTCERPVKQLR